MTVQPPTDVDGQTIRIRARGVGKRFSRYQRRATSLKERLVKHEQGVRDEFWALRDIDLTIHSGETVGLIGPNGSGKSTLLKVLSRILRPTEGTVEVIGRVASLLELGAGFDGELTGRENIYLNSALLGVPKHETEALFEQIVEFSELGDFIEDPVKHYSSGMYVRLGFSIAVHIDPDILIVDEVLAVGDAAFQKKCIDRIQQFQQSGKTILFVSHAAGLVEQLCTRVVLLSHGRQMFEGPPRQGSILLDDLLGVDRVERTDVGLAKVIAVALVDPGTGMPPDRFVAGGPALLMADLDWLAPDQISEVFAELAFINTDGEPILAVEPEQCVVPREEIHRVGGRSTLRWLIESLPQVGGPLTLRLSIRQKDTLLAMADIPGVRIQATMRSLVPGQYLFIDPAPFPQNDDDEPTVAPTEPVESIRSDSTFE